MHLVLEWKMRIAMINVLANLLVPSFILGKAHAFSSIFYMKLVGPFYSTCVFIDRDARVKMVLYRVHVSELDRNDIEQLIEDVCYILYFAYFHYNIKHEI